MKRYAFGSPEHLALVGKRLIVAGVVIIAFVAVTSSIDSVTGGKAEL